MTFSTLPSGHNNYFDGRHYFDVPPDPHFFLHSRSASACAAIRVHTGSFPSLTSCSHLERASACLPSLRCRSPSCTGTSLFALHAMPRIRAVHLHGAGGITARQPGRGGNNASIRSQEWTRTVRDGREIPDHRPFRLRRFPRARAGFSEIVVAFRIPGGAVPAQKGRKRPVNRLQVPVTVLHPGKTFTNSRAPGISAKSCQKNLSAASARATSQVQETHRRFDNRETAHSTVSIRFPRADRTIPFPP